MKFPISRESLQNFDPVQEKKIRDDIDIQNHVNSLVREICGKIQSRMEWTTQTDKELRATAGLGLNRNKQHKDEHEKIMSKKQFIWDGLRYIRPGSKYGINVSEVSETVLIPLLVSKLKETFIGCDIIIDPLKTYLIVDWS